jgi:DNA-binding transcriptional LysR family regulator
LGNFRTRNSQELGLLAIQFELMKAARLHNIKEVNDLIGLMTLLESNEGIGILPTHVERLALPNVKFIKLHQDENDENAIFRGVMCWRRSSDSPAMRELRRILREVGGTQGNLDIRE